MDRAEIDIKRIEDKTNRRVTFHKRRRGLLKMAREFAILCDIHVAVGVDSSSGSNCKGGGGLHNSANAASSKPPLLSIEDLNCTCKINTVANSCALDRLLRDSQNLQRELCIRVENVKDLKRLSDEELSAVEVKMGRALQNINIHRTYKELELLKKKEKQLEMENDELKRQIEAIEYGSPPDAVLHFRALDSSSSDDDTIDTAQVRND